MRRNFVFVLLVVGLSACNVLKPEQDSKTGSITTSEPDPGKQDYWPLAVGNTWEYERSEVATQYTPKGNNPLSGSGFIQTRVISYKKVNDTLEVFMLLTISDYTDYYGHRKNAQDTFQLYRTTDYIGGLKRTGVPDTLKQYLSGYNNGPYGTNAYYLKGIGRKKSEWSIFSHITAGNEIRGTGSETLIKYTLKP